MQIIEADHYTILYCRAYTATTANATTTVMKNKSGGVLLLWRIRRRTRRAKNEGTGKFLYLVA